MITVVNRRYYRSAGVDITRKGILGNPFVIGKDGSRQEVIEKYSQWLWDQMGGGSAVDLAIADLTKRHVAGEHVVLICCCKPEDCHGDIIDRAIRWLSKNRS